MLLSTKKKQFIVDPESGRRILTDDIDALVEMYDKLVTKRSELSELIALVKGAIAAQATGKTKTQYLQGHKRKVRVVQPGPSWDQGILRSSWSTAEFVNYREQLLKIERFGVKLREFNKAIKTNGPHEWNAFRDEVVKAQREPTHSPTITVVE